MRLRSSVLGAACAALLSNEQNGATYRISYGNPRVAAR